MSLHDYSLSELVDMILIYGECNQNADAAKIRYKEVYPQRRAPSASLFISILQCLKETGRIIPPTNNESSSEDSDISEYDSDEDTEEEESDSITPIFLKGDPEFNFILPDECYPIRKEFCTWLLEKFEADKTFLSNILYTEEVSFTDCGIFKFNDNIPWLPMSPQLECTPDFCVNIWVGIINKTILGPVILPDNLNSDTYLKFLKTDFQTLLETLPLSVQENMWFLHNGEYPHFDSNVQEYIKEKFNDKWISVTGPIKFPNLSPDLHPASFYFFKYLKNLVYTEVMDNQETLKNRVLELSKFIVNENSCNGIEDSLVRRAKTCIEVDGEAIYFLL